jgi:hypothetical protein
MKPRYMLMYAKNLAVPPQPGNTAIETFRTRVGYFWFLLRNKAARDAIRADRFRFIVIEGEQKHAP